jgi:molybdate transport system permease protein
VVLSFAHTMGEFGVVLMIGGKIPGVTKVASLAIFDEVESLRFASAHFYALFLFALSFLILMILFAVNRKLLKPF